MSASSFPPRCASRFRSERLLGQGGFGDVWLATQIGLERPVAIKFIRTDESDPEQLKRFENEAQVTSRLSHPCIVKVIDHDVEDGVPWIAYEYLPGRSLAQVLEKGPLHWEQALSVAQQIAGALEEAHSQGVIHRDIKPDNMLEVEPGRYKLADFGIAKWTASTQVHTKTGFIMGTPTHIPPEQIKGEAASPQGDVYALGVVLYQMLTGRLPFQDESMIGILRQHLDQAPTTPSRVQAGLPLHVDTLVKQALEKTPGKRFADGGAMRRALEAVPRPGGADTAARPAGDEAPAPPPVARMSTGRLKRPGVARPDSVTRAVYRADTADARPPPVRPPRARFVLAAGIFLAIGAVGLVALWRPAPRPAPSPAPVVSPVAAPSPSPTATAAAERDIRGEVDAKLRPIRELIAQLEARARRKTAPGLFNVRVLKNPDEIRDYLERALVLASEALEHLQRERITGPVWADAVFIEVDKLLDYCAWLKDQKEMGRLQKRIDALVARAGRYNADRYARFLALTVKARQVALTGGAVAGANALQEALDVLEAQADRAWLSSIAGVWLRLYVAAEIANLIDHDLMAVLSDPRPLVAAWRKVFDVYEELASAPGSEATADPEELEYVLRILSKQIESAGRFWKASCSTEADRVRAEALLRDALRRLQSGRFAASLEGEREKQAGKATEILRSHGK